MKNLIIYILIFTISSSCFYSAMPKSLLQSAGEANNKKEAVKNNALNMPDTLSGKGNTDSAASSSLPLEEKQSKLPPKEETSFFSANLLYFVGAAVAAAIIYIVLPEKDPEVKTKATFGTPLQPK